MAGRDLISFDDALMAITSRYLPPGAVESVSLGAAGGRVLAEEICSDDDYPRFDNSAVDGYAVSIQATAGTSFRVMETIGAGSEASVGLSDGEAARVFTGAPIPVGAIGVAMQEDVVIPGEGHIELTAGVEGGQNIRTRGSEIKSGERLLFVHEELTPGAIGLLALCGRTQVRVRAVPRVALVTTGDELVDASQKPKGAQIRDTSGPMLSALFSQWGVPPVSCLRVPDDPVSLRDTLSALASGADLIVVTGGVSVGGRDFLPDVVRELGEIVFHGVRMRPGKPVLFGQIGQCLLFGLPGNPGGSFVACHTFVREALVGLRGGGRRAKWASALFAEERRANAREDFTRVTLEARGGDFWAVPCFEQASFGLRSLAACDGIARLPANVPIHRGDPCWVLIV